MASLNQCNFIGNLGKDPEVRVAPSGTKSASFSIACSETWKDKATGERKEKTEWIPCVAWGALAGVIEQYVHKGSKIHVTGKFTTRSWDDPAGQKKYRTEIVVGDMIMLDGKRDGQGSGQGGMPNYGNGGQAEGAPPMADDSDLPF